MSTLKKLASQTLLYGLSSILPRVLNYLLVPLHTRVFAPAEFGVVTKLYAFIAFLVVLLTYGMETAYFNFTKDDKYSGRAVYSTALLSLISTTIFFTSIFVVFAQPIAGALNFANHADYIIWFALILAIDALTAIPFAKLRREGKAMQFAGIKMVNIVLNVALNIIFLKVFPHYGLYNPTIGVGYIFIANLLASVLTLLLLSPQFFVKYEFDKVLLKRMLVYALPLLFAGLAGMTNETIDRVLMDSLLPDSLDKAYATGIYGACYKLAMMMSIFIQAYRFAAEPFFFSTTKTGDAQKNIATTTKYLSIICWGIFLVIIFYMDILKYFVDERYWSGLNIVPILLIGYVCFAIYTNASMWFKLSGQTKYGAYFAFFGAFITIAANVILIPRIGIIGGAWTTLICYASMLFVCIFIGQKKYFIAYDFKAMGLYSILALALFATSQCLHLGLLLNTLLLLIFGVVIFAREKSTLLS